MFRLYVYGSEEDSKKTLSFLPKDTETIKVISSTKEFVRQVRNHDTFDISAILVAGLAVDSGFKEYYSVMPVTETGLIFTNVRKAHDAPVDGKFKKSTLLDDKVNVKFIMGGSHLMAEIIDDGWAEFNKNIKDEEIDTFIGSQFPVYEIDNNIYGKFVAQCEAMNDLMPLARKIEEIQRSGISPEMKATMMAQVHAQQREQQRPSVEKVAATQYNNINEPSSGGGVGDNPAMKTIMNTYFGRMDIEQRLRQKAAKTTTGNKSDFVNYYAQKYGTK